MESELSFPRGGKKFSRSSKENDINSKGDKKHNGTAKSRKRKIASHQVVTLEKSPKTAELFVTAAEDLSYKKLQEEMLILACVRNITPLSLDLELPGKMGGMVKITSISEYYSQLLEQEIIADDIGEEKVVARLNKMFHVGQFLPAKVMEKLVDVNGTKVQLSIDPQDINAQLNHRVFKQGLVIWAAVSSKLDHGYQLDAGVKNTTIFLPFKNVNETDLVVGQPMWCFVEKCNVTSLTANMSVSILEEHLKSAIQTDLSLHYVLPGMQFNLKITKSVKYGLEGQFMNRCVGYINESYLAASLEKTSKYKEGQVVNANLLYVEPTTNLSYFTLKSLGGDVLSEHEIGKILRAQILSKVIGGLNIVFPNKEVGFVSYKRLVKMLPQSANIKDVIEKRFPLGSSHQCRILDYNRMQKLYICTFEQSILKEKHFTEQDIKIGELLSVKVEKITSHGLQVLIGKVHGFIMNIHLFNSEYSETIKKKFTKGQTLQARVINIDHRGVYLTLKDTLVNSELCLSTYDDPTCYNRQYPGVVVHKSARGLLLTFYGDVRGMLFKTHLTEMYPDYTDDMFYIGEVITPTIMRLHKNLFHLSLKPPKQIHEKPIITVGKYVDAVVVKNDEKGLEVEVTPHNIPAFIPNAHLSTSLGLNYLLCLTYKIGDKIKGLLCVQSRSRKPILSLREAMAYKSQNLEIKKAVDIQVGSIVRCEYEYSDDTGIYVLTPCISQVLKFKIPNKELVHNKKILKELKFEPHQPLLAKVTKLSSNSKIESATAMLPKVFSYNYEHSLNLWEQYIKDTERIRTYLLEQKAPLAKLELGNYVQCSVTAVKNGNCKVIVNDCLRGLVAANHFPKSISVGDKLVGIVLWVNYEEQFVEVSLNEDVMKKVNSVQDGIIDKPLGSTVHAEILLTYTKYVIGVLKNHDTNRQLVFLPPKLHENAFNEEINYECSNKKVKVVICRKVNNKLIVMNKAYIHTLKKAEKRKISGKDRVAKKPRLDKDVAYKKSEKKTAGDYSDDDNELSMDEDDYDEDNEVKDVKVVEVMEESLCDHVAENEEDNDNMQAESSDSEHVEESESESEHPNENSDEGSEGECDDDDDEDSLDASESKEIESSGNLSSTETVDQSSSRPILPGVRNYFSALEVNLKESSSDDDYDEEKKEPKKKKKLSASERNEIARLEEEKLIRIETENADATVEPHTVDQFQKLVKGKPNCSKLWSKYVVYLTANAEIDKARSVAREALKTIDFNLIEERLNIWILCLNLENSYGDKSTFEEIFQEAIRCSNDQKIYLTAIKILADSQKFTEMEEKIQKAKRKFKQVKEMWIEIGRIYYMNGKLKEARNLKDSALKTLESKSLHIQLIIDFAIMEFQYGEKNHGEALFETVLQYSPKRIDIWSRYIDQVIKKGDLEAVRRLIERAKSQDIPRKKLNTLLQKYSKFGIENED